LLGGATIKKCQLKVWKLRYLHYFSTSDVNMSIRRSEKHQGTQIYWFDLLLFNQNWINFEKPSKKSWFLSTFKVFQEFFNPGWKVADQTQKFVFLEVFRFFWHLYQQQVRRNSGWKESWAKIPVCSCTSVRKKVPSISTKYVFYYRNQGFKWAQKQNFSMRHFWENSILRFLLT